MKKYMVLAVLLSFFHTGYGMKMAKIVGERESNGVTTYGVGILEECEGGFKQSLLFLSDDREIKSSTMTFDQKGLVKEEENKLDPLQKERLLNEIKEYKSGAGTDTSAQELVKLSLKESFISLKVGGQTSTSNYPDDKEISYEQIINHIKKERSISPFEKSILMKTAMSVRIVMLAKQLESFFPKNTPSVFKPGD